MLAQEVPIGERARQSFIDGQAGEVEVVDILAQREFGDRYLIFDQPRMLLGNFRLYLIAHDPGLSIGVGDPRLQIGPCFLADH